MPIGTKLEYAYNCVEILGQILRNFTGSLPGDRKLTILKTTYLLGLRTLRAVLGILSQATMNAKEEIAKRDQTKAQDREYVKSIERLLTIVGQLVGGSVFRVISLNVGTADIEEGAYAETLDEIGRNNATQLVDLAIKLDHFAQYPFEDIRRLHKQYTGNRFADNVLRDLVIGNMHVFDIGWEMRQRVLNTLGMRPADSSILSRATKRLSPGSK